MGEADLGRQPAHDPLVVGKDVGVHEADGDAADTDVVDLLELSADGRLIGPAQDADGLSRQCDQARPITSRRQTRWRGS